MKKKIGSIIFGVLLVFNLSVPIFANDSPKITTSSDDFKTDNWTLSEAISLKNSKIETDKDFSEGISVKDLKLTDFTKISDDIETEVDSTQGSIQTGLPDLSMSSITSEASQPFTNSVPIMFKTTISNIGTASVNSLIFTLYVDDNYDTEIQATGTLNAGEQAVLSFYSECNVGGYHSFKIVVNESRSLQESNYNNNTGTGYFHWADCIALSADSLKISFLPIPMQNRTITFKISNKGTLDASDVPLELDVNGSIILSITIDLPARSAKMGTLDIMFYKAGRYEFKLALDPKGTIKDLDLSNNYKYLTLNVPYDAETWAGKWEDPKDLDVLICASASEEINNSNAGSNAISNAISAIHEWDGINSNVSYGDTTVSNSEEDLGMPVAVIATDFGPNNANLLAQTQMYKQGSDGREYIEDVENDESTYIWAVVVLNTESYHVMDAKGQHRTMTHEFGHVLGLAHPECQDVAIMRQTSDPLSTFTIQPHDIFSLDALY